MRLARCSPTIALLILLSPVLARAAWLPGGNRIGDEAGTGHSFVATASGPHRIVVAWITALAPGGAEMRAQAWTAEGDLAAGWPSAGVVVSQLPGVYGRIAICEDGAGGAFVAWAKSEGNESIVYLQRLSAGGTPAAGWAAEGLRLSEVPSAWPAVAHDGAGGVLVGWLEHDGPPNFVYRAHIQRFDAAGAPASGWPAFGLVLQNVYDLSLAVDGEGRVFVSTAEYLQGASARMRVLRLDASAVPDPGWPQTGAQFADIYPALMKLYPDGAGGVFAGWTEVIICVDFCSMPPRLMARVLGDGSPDDGWIPSPRSYSNAPDRTGGMLLGLVNGGRPSAVRLDAGGAAMTGWAAEGNAAMTEIVDPREVLVAGDGDGGAFITWRDNRTGEERLYASRLDASGRLVEGWPLTGSFVGSAHGYLSTAQLVTLGGDVAIALWEESTTLGGIAHLTALRPGEPGPLAPIRPVQGDVGFGVVQVRPNPARGPIAAIIELPNEGPARLALVDAAGRVVESQDFAFEWQARGAVLFNRGRTLPTGVYWLRLTQGSRLASRKVVVLE